MWPDPVQPMGSTSHVGPFEGLIPPEEITPYHSHFLGETQIVDGVGNVLARLSHGEGEGVVVAEVTLGAKEPRHTVSDRFWIPDLPPSSLEAWDKYNALGREYYYRTTLPYRTRKRTDCAL